MCELFGFSAAAPASLATPLGLFRRRGGLTADNRDGWGLAYRTARGFVLEKEPAAAADSARYQSLSETLEAQLVIAHVRHANPPTAHVLVNTHPFARDCCGRQWVFAHNGKVPEVLRPDGCCRPQGSRPAGETDSEHAFFYLLDEIAAAFTHTAARHDVWLERLAGLSARIAAYGRFNFLMSDGDYLIAYGHDRLHSLARNDGTAWLASEPLTAGEPWEAFRPGELQVFRDGVRIARLVPRAPEADLSRRPDGPPRPLHGSG